MAAEVNGNSAPVKEDEEPMDITVTHTENYQTLLAAGLPQKVAESLDNIFQTGGGCSVPALCTFKDAVKDVQELGDCKMYY